MQSFCQPCVHCNFAHLFVHVIQRFVTQDYFIAGLTIYTSSTQFGQGIGPIFFTNIGCSGSESSLLECSRSVFGVTSCTHSQDIGVKCEGNDLKHQLSLIYALYGYLTLPHDTYMINSCCKKVGSLDPFWLFNVFRFYILAMQSSMT